MRKAQTQVAITPPNFQVAEFQVKGTAPYVQLRFSEKAKAAMMEKMGEGPQAKKGRKRMARDFDADYEQSMYLSEGTGMEGIKPVEWRGIPATSFRSAMISACRLVGFQMTKAKLAVFVIADGVDKGDGTPLIRIEGKPRRLDSHVRNATGVADIRVRAQWMNWEATVRVRYDADLFSVEDITNLMMRAGMQVGVGEGRPDSKQSHGMGWGTFEIAGGKK